MALWQFNDTQTRQRRNREAIIGRLLMPMHDVNELLAVDVLPKSIDGDDILNGGTTHYTVASLVAIVNRITVANVSATAYRGNIHFVPMGGSRNVANSIFREQLNPGDAVAIDGPFFIAQGTTFETDSPSAPADSLSMRAEALEFNAQPPGMTLRVVDGVALGSSVSTYYTAPAIVQAIVQSILLCNSDSVDRTATVYIVESGGSVSVRKCIFSGVLPAYTTTILSGPFQMDPGDTVRAFASTAGVVAMRVTPLELTT